MKLVALETTRARRPLSQPLRTAAGCWAERESVLVRVTADDATRGHGEACPLPGWSPDGLDDVESALSAAAELFPLELDPCLPWAAQVRGLLRTLALTPAARFALETALLDLGGRRLGVPVSVLLAGRFPGAPLQLNALVGAEEPAAAADEARAAVGRGFTTLKLKIGRAGAFEADLARLAAVRAAVGPAIALRADANGAFAPHVVAERLAALVPFGLEYLEQPVGARELLDLPPAAVPLAADESLVLPGALDRLLATGACRVLVLKPMLLGGALPCLAFAARARAAGVDAVVTGMLDGPVATAATLDVGFALAPRRACGIDLSVLGAAAPLCPPREAPGLGLPDPAEFA